MRTVFLPVALIGLSMGPAALADDDNQGININGEVKNTCRIAKVERAIIDAGDVTQNSLSENTSEFTFSNIANTGTAIFNSGGNSNKTLRIEFSEVYCNYAHKLGVRSESQGMKSPTSIGTTNTGNFQETIHYRLQAEYTGIDNTIAKINTTRRQQSSINVTSPYRGPMEVTVTVTPSDNEGGKPLLAGGYTDTARVILGASF